MYCFKYLILKFLSFANSFCSMKNFFLLKQLFMDNVEVDCKHPVKSWFFPCLLHHECHCFAFLFNVTVNAASVFSEFKFLNCLHCIFNGVFGNFYRFYWLNYYRHWQVAYPTCNNRQKVVKPIVATMTCLVLF